MGASGLLPKLLFFIVVFTFVEGRNKKARVLPCPDEIATACIKCDCDEETGSSKCVPMRECPRPITKTENIRKKKGTENCPFSKQYIAECVACECSGSGGDHCAMCYALPARRIGQPPAVNQLLPQAVQRRLTNYEVNGWRAPEE